MKWSRATLPVLASFLIVSGCQQQPDNVVVHSYGATAGGGSLGIHTVRAGETPWAISQAYQVELRDLLEINHLSPPYYLKAGGRLKIPAPRNYTVHTRDTLYSISRLFGTTVTELVRLNKIPKPYRLTKGQVIRLPAQYADETIVVASTKPLAPITATRSVNSKIEVVELPPQGQNITPVTSPSVVAPAEPAIVATTQKTMAGKNERFLRPVAGRILSGYGPKNNGLHNDGINIQAVRGAPVVASKSGTVVYAGDDIDGYGNLILVRHGDGFMTAYAHMEKLLVKKGDAVKRGQVIGKAGSTGHVDTPQVHFEIRKGKQALDPSIYL